MFRHVSKRKTTANTQNKAQQRKAMTNTHNNANTETNKRRQIRSRRETPYVIEDPVPSCIQVLCESHVDTNNSKLQPILGFRFWLGPRCSQNPLRRGSKLL